MIRRIELCLVVESHFELSIRGSDSCDALNETTGIALLRSNIPVNGSG